VNCNNPAKVLADYADLKIELFQKPISDINAVFEAVVFIALAIALHRAAGYAGANRSKEQGDNSQQ